MAQGDRGLESEPGVQGVGGDPEIERQGRPESQWERVGSAQSPCQGAQGGRQGPLAWRQEGLRVPLSRRIQRTPSPHRATDAPGIHASGSHSHCVLEKRDSAQAQLLTAPELAAHLKSCQGVSSEYPHLPAEQQRWTERLRGDLVGTDGSTREQGLLGPLGQFPAWSGHLPSLSFSLLICKRVIMNRTCSGSQKPPNICEVCGILRGRCQCLQAGIVEGR